MLAGSCCHCQVPPKLVFHSGPQETSACWLMCPWPLRFSKGSTGIVSYSLMRYNVVMVTCAVLHRGEAQYVDWHYEFFFSSPQRWQLAADLQQVVYAHLAVYVPRIFCLGPSASSSSREEQREDLACQLLLLAPLEWLLLGEEPASGLALLQEKNQPSPLCGHVFKVGEPTYSCR